MTDLLHSELMKGIHLKNTLTLKTIHPLAMVIKHQREWTGRFMMNLMIGTVERKNLY
jgi:hypothetical protein